MNRKPDIVITVQSTSGLQLFKIWAVPRDAVPPGMSTVHRISNSDGTIRDDLVLVTVAEVRRNAPLDASKMAIH